MPQNKLIHNTIYNILKTFSTILFPLITFPYITRVLQPDNVGKIDFGNSIVSYFSLLATLGIKTYAIRECAKEKYNKEELGNIAGKILSINLLTTAIAYTLLVLLLVFYNKLYDYRTIIIIQSTVILFTTLGADWINVAMEDFKYITLRTIIFQIISLIAVIFFVKGPSDYIKYAIITVFSSSGANIANIFYRKKYCRINLTLKMDLKTHFLPIISLFAMLVAQQIFTMCDVTIIGLTLGDYNVGLYSVAMKVYTLANQVIASITWVVIPQLSIAYINDNIKDIERILTYVFKFTVTAGLPCVVIIFMLSPEITALIAGDAYIGAAVTLKILAGTLIVTFINNFLLNINVLAAKKDKIGTISCASAAIINIITNIIFIPRFGIEAAAVTTMLSQVIIALICFPYLDKRIHLGKIAKSIFQPLGGCLCISVIILLVKSLYSNAFYIVCISIGASVIVYFTVLLLLKQDLIINFCSVLLSKGKKNKK